MGGNVVSAAIVEGNLILGLSDGSVINCGRAQGPQGLQGPQGPIGATGDRGTDGNTILTFAGTPGNEMGVEGDYAIDNINWRIYGPKAGGVWGKAKSMLPDPENLIVNGRTASGATGGGGGGEGGGGQPITQVFTNTVIATGQGRLTEGRTPQNRASVDYPGGPEGIIPPETGMQVQSNINAFFVNAVEALEYATAQEIRDRIKGDEELKKLIEDEIAGAIRTPIYADTPPLTHPDFTGDDAILIEGDVWYDTSNNGIRYRYDNGDWVAQERPAIFSDSEPTEHPSLQGSSATLLQGDIWYDTNDGLLEYVYDGTDWVEQGGAYVKKKGDDMLGDLNMLDNSIHNVKDPSLQKDAANRQFVTTQSAKAASVPVQQADWTNQVYSTGQWILQADGATDPDIQRFILSDNAFADTQDLDNVKYISVHALGGGAFINYQNEKVGDTIQIYGNPDVGDAISFGIYTIDAITEHNMPVPGPGADYTDAFVAYTVTKLASYGALEVDELCQIKTMPPVGVGGANVEIGPNPEKDDDEYEEGDLWFDTSRLELFVYYVDPIGIGGWVSCSPLGARVEAGEIIQQQLLERVSEGEAAQATLQSKVAGLETTSGNYLLLTGGVMSGVLNMNNNYIAAVRDPDNDTDATNRRYVENNFVSLYGNNTVASNGGEWRIQGASKTFIKVDANANKLGLFNLQDASEDHHAISRGWAKSNTVLRSGANTVSDGWKIQGPEKTHFHVDGNQTKIYWLQDPSHAQHPVTMGWADNKYAQSSSLSSYLPLAGGTLTGNLSFGNNARIDCNNSNTVLHGRGCFELRAAAAKPLIFSSGSGSNKLVAFYGYDGSADDNKSEKAYITAGGEARFKKVYSDGKELATKEYVDASVPTTGTSDDIEWYWHVTAANSIANASIYYKTNDIGSVTYVRIATQGKDGKKIDMVNFSRKQWQLPFSIYAETETGKHIIAAGRTSHVECKVASSIQYVELEFTNSSDMLNWRRDSVDDLTLVKVKVAGLLP